MECSVVLVSFSALSREEWSMAVAYGYRRAREIFKGLRSTRIVPKQGQWGVLVHLIFPTVEVLLMETGGATLLLLPSMGSQGPVMTSGGCPGHAGHSHAGHSRW